MSSFLYYPDKLKLHFPGFTVNKLRKILPLSKLPMLTDHHHFSFIEYNSYVKNPFGLYHPTKHSSGVNFGTTLDIICLKKSNFRKLLESYEINGHSYLSYVELAVDYLCDSQENSIRLVKETSEQMCRKWVHNYHNCSRQPQQASLSKQGYSRFYADEGCYWGFERNRMRLVVYPAYSKRLWHEKAVPAVHIEWRIKNTAVIYDKTGLSDAADILDLDFASAFSNLFQRHIDFKKIDHEKHGRWLLNVHHNTKVDKTTATTESIEFCNQRNIINYAELREYYKKTKKKAKKLKENHLNLSKFDERILLMSGYYLSSFAYRTDPPTLLKRFYINTNEIKK